MSEQSKSRGYEAPISSKEEDFFDRWRLASEIWNLINNSPSDWSVRVGVYGKWGEGKTSVLKFLKKMGKDNSDIIVWFNPWAINDRDALWSSFATQIFSALDEAGIEVKGSKFFKAKIWTKKAIDPIKKASEFNNYSKAIVGGALSVLSGFLDVNGKIFKSIRSGLGERRLIVIIDDLDRSNPKLLPELFLSLREVLDLPGLVFVLAFDVNIVANALAQEYPAWGKGEEFLEKIIDFPISLPVPSDEQVRRLLDHELSESFPFVERQAIQNVFHVLPRNPRKLKLLLRYLWTLKKQIDRHEDRELDWSTIILWQLLKIESSHFARLFSESKDAIAIVSAWRLYLNVDAKDESEEHRKVKAIVKDILLRVDIKESDFRYQRIMDLLMLLGEKNSAITPVNLLYQINLLDRPHAVTWKEFSSLMNVWKSAQNTKSVNSWIVDHAINVSATEEAVAREIFSSLINYRLERLEDAASVITVDEHSVIMADVSLARKLLEELFVGGLECVGKKFFRIASRFRSMWGMIQKWFHFRKNEDDEKERLAEEDTLLNCVRYSIEDPSGYIDALAPWEEGEFPWKDHGELIDNLRKKMVAVVEPHVAQQILELLKSRGGIASLWGHDSNISEKYVLFNIDGPLWDDTLKKEVMSILSEAGSKRDVHQNAFEILRMISHGEKEGIGIPYGREKLKKIICNKDIAGAIWGAAVARPIQYRSHSRVREIRTQFLDIAGTDEYFPWPYWLGEDNEQ